MLILDFFKKFPDENSCRLYLKEKREEQGIVCKCGCTKHYWLKAKSVWQCSSCDSRRNLKAGTIMEQSKLPLQYWFIAIHLMTSTKKSFSALELQRQLDHNRYQPIWYMMTKIRVMMGKRDAQYKLKGCVEMDEGYFEIVNLVHKGKLKKGRGSQRQKAVLVMVESTPTTAKEKAKKKNKYQPDKKIGFVKMIVIDDTSEKTINYEVRRGIDRDSIVDTDSWKGYGGLKSIVGQHNAMVVPKKEAHKKLPWVHTIIANAKRKLLGIHHSIGKEYLQNYLNEYVYKLNRRDFDSDIFDRMIIAGANNTWY